MSGPSSEPVYPLAFAHDSRRFDGIFRHLLTARRALEGSPYTVQIYTCYDPSLRSEYPELGVGIAGHRFPGGGDLERGWNRILPVFARRLREVPEPLVHVWSVSLAGLVRYRDDVIVTVADLAKLTTRYYGRIASHLHNRMLPHLTRARAVVTSTEWGRAEILRLLPLAPDRVFVAPPAPVDWPVGAPPPRPRSSPPGDRRRRLLTVAVDRPHKNLAFFLRVLSAAGPGYEGTIVTRPGPATLALVRELGLGDRVEFVTDVPELFAVYASADVFVFPSLHEGFGIPLAEAMAAGLPILASDRTCIPEVVGTGGRILPPEDPQVWATALRELEAPARYEAGSALALGRAEEFTPTKLRERWVRLYDAAREMGPAERIRG